MNVERIGKKNEIYKDIKLLYKTNNNDTIVTDDINVIKLMIDNNITINTFLYCDELTYKSETLDLIKQAINIAKNSFSISKDTFDSLAQKENSIGLIATTNLITYQLCDFINKDYLVVCDGLETPGNVGTIYRTLDSAKVDGLICVNEVAKLSNPKLTTSARGCNLLVPTVNTTYLEACKWLLDNNYDIYLGEPNLGLNYKEYSYKGKIAIVVGSERFGITQDWYNHKHKKVYIPMFGSNNSLNVSVATSILVYEATMKRNNL